MKKNLRNVFFKVWYWYVSTVDKNADVTFMNYGYSRNNDQIKLEDSDEKNRYSVQLYHFVAEKIDHEGKDILEVGCGRGGGLSFINRHFTPNSATGLDLNSKAIDFCNKYYTNENIKFLQGNAEKLEFQNDSFDVVINVESSHRYSQMDEFVNEIYRVLKHGGIFLFTDFRPKNELEKLHNQLKSPNFKTLKYEVITSQILEALKLSSDDREELVRKLAPKFLTGIGKKFAATKGTPTYNKFMTSEFEYVYYMLEKE